MGKDQGAINILQCIGFGHNKELVSCLSVNNAEVKEGDM